MSFWTQINHTSSYVHQSKFEIIWIKLSRFVSSVTKTNGWDFTNAVSILGTDLAILAQINFNVDSLKEEMYAINLISKWHLYDLCLLLYNFSKFNEMRVNSGGASGGQPEWGALTEAASFRPEGIFVFYLHLFMSIYITFITFIVFIVSITFITLYSSPFSSRHELSQCFIFI